MGACRETHGDPTDKLPHLKYGPETEKSQKWDNERRRYTTTKRKILQIVSAAEITARCSVHTITLRGCP